MLFWLAVSVISCGLAAVAYIIYDIIELRDKVKNRKEK